MFQEEDRLERERASRDAESLLEVRNQRDDE